MNKSNWFQVFFLVIISLIGGCLDDSNIHVAPHVEITVKSNNIKVNETIIIDGSHSQGNSADIINFTWEFAHNGVNTEIKYYGEKIERSFKEEGTWTILLIATDEKGASDSDFIKINVES